MRRRAAEEVRILLARNSQARCHNGQESQGRFSLQSPALNAAVCLQDAEEKFAYFADFWHHLFDKYTQLDHELQDVGSMKKQLARLTTEIGSFRLLVRFRRRVSHLAHRSFAGEINKKVDRLEQALDVALDLADQRKVAEWERVRDTDLNQLRSLNVKEYRELKARYEFERQRRAQIEEARARDRAFNEYAERQRALQQQFDAALTAYKTGAAVPTGAGAGVQQLGNLGAAAGTASGATGNSSNSPHSLDEVVLSPTADAASLESFYADVAAKLGTAGSSSASATSTNSGDGANSDSSATAASAAAEDDSAKSLAPASESASSVATASPAASPSAATSPSASTAADSPISVASSADELELPSS